MDEKTKQTASFCSTVLAPKNLRLNKAGTAPTTLYVGQQLFIDLTNLLKTSQIRVMEPGEQPTVPGLGEGIIMKWDNKLDPGKWRFE